jgi:hypothetical protein
MSNTLPLLLPPIHTHSLQVLQQVRPQPGCSPAIIEVRQLDLGSLSSVRKFCQQYNKWVLGAGCCLALRGQRLLGSSQCFCSQLHQASTNTARRSWWGYGPMITRWTNDYSRVRSLHSSQGRHPPAAVKETNTAVVMILMAQQLFSHGCAASWLRRPARPCLAQHGPGAVAVSNPR